MPELDPFELRIAGAIRSMADRADTGVDPVAVARDAVGRGRPWLAWLGPSLRLSAPILVLLSLLLALLAWTLQLGAPWNRQAVVAPRPTPTPAVTISPSPSDDGVLVDDVAGTGTFWIVNPGTSVQVGEVTQVRGFVASSTVVMDDRRVSGTGTLTLAMDTRGPVGTEWGTFRLETADGAWEGPVSGGTWSDGNAGDVAGYLVGIGAYEGYSFYIDVRSSGFAMELEGIIFPGPPPGP
jgi:hypothetical protein